MFRTNQPEIYRKLQSYEIDEQIFYVQANIHKAWFAARKKPTIHQEIPLVLGQCPIDASVISENKLLTLTDYEHLIKELGNRFGNVLFKLHPYDWQKSKTENLFKSYGFAQFTEENIYQLLSEEKITEVYSISSSAVHEAKYFGKKGYFFRDIKPKNYIGVYNEFYAPYFWADILSPVLPTNKFNKISLPSTNNKLREIYNMYWGYDIFLNK
jgi:hypothetical protein